jgi:hypothetical protein
VFVCIGVVDVDALETGVVDQAAPRGVREDAEEVVVVLDTQRLSRLSQCDREVNGVRGDPKTQRGSRRSPQRGRSNGDAARRAYLMHAGNDANRAYKESPNLQELCRAL